METIVKNVRRAAKGEAPIEIAKTVVAFPSGSWSLNGVEIPGAVAEYLVNYGVRQCLADAYASAQTMGEAKGLFAKRFQRLLDGSIGVRESGTVKTADDPVLALALKNAKAALMARFEKVVPNAKRMADYAKHEKIAAYLRIDKQDANKATWIDASVVDWMDAQKDKHDYRAEAEKMLAVDLTIDLDF